MTTDNTSVVSYYDNRPVKVKKKVDCCTPNVVYLLQCTLHQKQYCGSSVNFKSRWSKHKNDMIQAMVGGKTVVSADTGPRNTVIPPVIYHMSELFSWTR